MLTVENEHTGCPSPSIIHKVTAEVPNLCGREDKGTGPCLAFCRYPSENTGKLQHKGGTLQAELDVLRLFHYFSVLQPSISGRASFFYMMIENRPPKDIQNTQLISELQRDKRGMPLIDLISLFSRSSVPLPKSF
jgi:hypothetical protein